MGYELCDWLTEWLAAQLQEMLLHPRKNLERNDYAYYYYIIHFYTNYIEDHLKQSHGGSDFLHFQFLS